MQQPINRLDFKIHNLLRLLWKSEETSSVYQQSEQTHNIDDTIVL